MDQEFDAVALKDLPPEQLLRDSVKARMVAFREPLVFGSRRSHSDSQRQFFHSRRFLATRSPSVCLVQLCNAFSFANLFSKEIHYWLTRKVARCCFITSSSCLHNLQYALYGNGRCGKGKPCERDKKQALKQPHHLFHIGVFYVI